MSGGKPHRAAAGPRLHQRIADWLTRRYLTVDTRWLGIFRFLLGGLLCSDLLRRWVVATTFYTNDGILPNHYSLFRPMGRVAFSLYHAFSTAGEVDVAFALTLVCFVLFTVGYKTKLFHLLSFVCITSLNARNVFVENGGTVVVNILTLWTLFLPLGRRFSVDAVLRSLRSEREQGASGLNRRPHSAPEAHSFTSLVVLALILQWCVVYLFNFLHKSGIGWENGTAIHWFWHQDRIVTWLGVLGRQHAPVEAIRWMTYGVIGMEAALAVVLLVPFWQVWMRRAALGLAVALHGGIAATSRLGPFSYVMTIFFFVLLSERDWQLMRRWFASPHRKRIVVFDSDCGLCFACCRLLKRLDPFERLVFVSNHDLERLPHLDRDVVQRTVVVIDAEGRAWTEERAVFEVIRALPLGLSVVFWMRIPGLAWLARRLYRAVAVNRVRLSIWLGQSACGSVAVASGGAAAPGEAELEGGTTFRAVAGHASAMGREMAVGALMVILGSQVAVDNRYLRRFFEMKQPEWMAYATAYPRLMQGWGMFAPEPPYEDGRMIVDGRTIDGRQLDPLTGRKPNFDPYTQTGWGHSQLWCDYHNRLRAAGHSGHRQFLRSYLLSLHELTGRPHDELESFRVWWVQDRSPAPGALRGEPLKPNLLLSHGRVRDSEASRWLRQGQPLRSGRRQAPSRAPNQGKDR